VTGNSKRPRVYSVPKAKSERGFPSGSSGEVANCFSRLQGAIAG